MKLYQTVPNAEASPSVVWSSSNADASKERTAFKAKGAKKPTTVEHDIPTNKTELLKWLNDNSVVVK
jgi:hypothetical protein